MIHYITPIGIGSAWVGNEISIVRGAGLPVVLHALHPSNQKFFSSGWAQELDRQTRVIYRASKGSILAAALRGPARFGARFWAALGNALVGERESLRNRAVALWHFLVACWWAAELRGRSAAEPVSLIHSQWIHSGGTVGYFASWLLGVPFSFTGHAADLYRERVALKDKVRRADRIICISTFHRDLYKELGARDEQLKIVYCGVDLSHFVERAPPPRTGRRLRIVSSGRLVEKKGFAHLIDAVGMLVEKGLDVECVIGGNGPLEAALREQVSQKALGERVTITGKPLTQEELPGFMAGGDVYALACVWAKDGDVDGLPQMLMEAMACGLPAVSTKLVGIPDLIEDGVSGLLVASGDVVALAGALERLLRDEALSRRLAAAGARVVREKFEIKAALEPLLEEFRSRLAGGASAAVGGARSAARGAGRVPQATGAGA